MVTLSLAIFLPILLAPIVALSRGQHILTSSLRVRGTAWSVLSVLLAVLAGYALVVAEAVTRLAGVEIVINGTPRTEPAFMSFYVWMQRFLPGMLLTVLALASAAFKTITSVFNVQKIPSLEDYLGRLEYQALPGSFAPVHGRRKLNFNAGGLSPMLKGVQHALLDQVSVYQSFVPGTGEARKYLEDCWSECKNLLRSVGIVSSAGRQVRLFSGTSRAMERGLVEVSHDLEVILSPYEHRSEYIVAEASHRIRAVPHESGFLELPWPEQKNRLFDGLRAASGGSGDFVFILSEVCWATGLRIPIEEVVIGLHEIWGAGRPILLIDGAHAVGNAPPPHPLNSGQVYVFSAHKWLMSPEPCGILISANARPIYDAWVEQVPDTSVGASEVCGLRASLRLLSRMSVDARRSRVEALRERMLKAIAPELSVVGSVTGLERTGLVGLKISTGFKWRFSLPEIVERLRRREVNILVIEDESITAGTGPWLRVSVPFFSDWGEILRLSRILKSLVEERR
jgi:selenocysteine lyase/cysteine desulfurase